MSQVYAICTVDGVIRLTEAKPADGQFGLAVGDMTVLSDVIWDTAVLERLSGVGSSQLRVPGTESAQDGRGNLEAIAVYIQRLKALESQATVIDFEDDGQGFQQWTVNHHGMVIDSQPNQANAWAGVYVLNISTLQVGGQVEYEHGGHTGALRPRVKALQTGAPHGFRAMGA